MSWTLAHLTFLSLLFWFFGACSAPTRPTSGDEGARPPATPTPSVNPGVVSPTSGSVLKPLTDADTPSVDDIIRKCGVTPEQIANPNSILFEKSLRGLTKRVAGTALIISYDVRITPLISIRNQPGVGKTNVDFDIQANLSIAKSQAEKQTAPFRGLTETVAFKADELGQLGASNKEYEGLFCTALPIKELTSYTGGTQIKVQFSPALANSVSPKADADLYQKELGTGRSFNVTANVVQGKGAATTGRQIPGTVRITPVTPTAQVDNLGTPMQIVADVAFKVDALFESPQVTKDLGISLSQTFFINTKSKDFTAIIIDTGEPQFGQLVLLGQ